MNSLTKERLVLAVCGVIAAAVAITLAAAGNPGNMAICVACFIRDSAGALKLHTAAPVQYLRPEIIGIVLGAFVMSIAGREFKSTAGLVLRSPAFSWASSCPLERWCFWAARCA